SPQFLGGASLGEARLNRSKPRFFRWPAPLGGRNHLSFGHTCRVNLLRPKGFKRPVSNLLPLLKPFDGRNPPNGRYCTKAEAGERGTGPTLRERGRHSASARSNRCFLDSRNFSKRGSFRAS